MIVDTGPLIAMVDTSDDDHVACSRVASALEEPLQTTWAVITEALYMLFRSDGWRGQRQILEMLTIGDLVSHHHDSAQIDRIHILMEKYRDVPMDFADASIVALAESINSTRIFTLDSDFRIYRFRDKDPFDIVP